MGLSYYEENSSYCYGIWKIEEDEASLKNLLGNEIDAPFSNPGKRIEHLAVRALAQKMNLDPHLIAYKPSGKPHIMFKNLTISISHTKGYAALLLSSHIYVGIDIEQKTDRILKVRKKFMHPKEEERIANINGDEMVALLLHWCAKESLFKAIPDEGVDFIEEIRVIDFTSPSKKGSFIAKALRNNIEFQVDYRIEDDYVLTCCLSTEAL
jgi:4'-phosphopantetheinyl transferase